MQWYYADAGRQVGPVDDAAFEELVRTGVVRDDTPIWREGLADWQLYATVRPPRPAPPSPPAPPAAPVEATGFCTQCGGRFSTAQLAMVGNRQMCPACRQAAAPAPAPVPAAAEPTGFCTHCGGRFPTAQLSRVGNGQMCATCLSSSSAPTIAAPAPSNPGWTPPSPVSGSPAIPAATPLTQFATPAAGDYATWANRVIGYLIDSIFVVIAMIILGIVGSLFFGSMVGLGSLGSSTGADLGVLQGIGGTACCFIFALIPISTLAVGIYNKVYLVSQRGFSIGQGVMKIKIVDGQGNKLTFGTALIRLLAQAGLSFIPFGGAIDLLWPLWDAQRQTLHDKAVGSFAINNPSGQ